MGRAIVAVLALLIAACGDGDTRTLVLERVSPSVDPGCGAPSDARNITVTARGDFPPQGAAQTDPVAPGIVDITRFPDNTRVLEVRVEGAGGEELTIGRTAEIVLADFADGDSLHVFMAPRRGSCRVDDMAVARIRPLVARAGPGVLVAGGVDGAGDPVGGVERYDPTLGGFVAVPGSLYDDGLTGASMTSLSDGRVAIVGGAQTAFQLYDPRTDDLGQPSFLDGARAHHAAVELADGRLLLAGGCAALTATGECDFARALVDTVLLDLDSGQVEPGPSLAVGRAGGAALRDADGRVLISGGVNAAGEPVAQAERISPTGGLGQGIAEVTGRPAPLQSGAALAAFADGLAGAAVFVVPPGSPTAVRVDEAPQARAGATTTALEDGTVLAVGGGTDRLALYVPASGELVSAGVAPVDLRDHAAVLLGDGAVLVLGGRDGAGDARAEAWIYRHDLVGPFSPQFDLADPAQAELLSPSDPSRVVRELSPTRYTLQGTAGAGELPSEWLIAGGPRFVEPTVRVSAGVVAGGMAIMLGFESAADYHYVELQGGQAARLWRVLDGVRVDTGCAGQPLSANLVATAEPNPLIELVVEAGELIVTLAGDALLTCTLDDEIPRGAIGIGVIGDGTASIELDRITGVR